MLNSAFDGLGARPGDYYPELLRAEIDALNARIYPAINNGVYRAGFATTQAAYEEAFDELFAINVRGVFFTVQKLLPLLRAARAEWEQEHAASPTTTDLAAQLDMPNAEVRELEQAGSAYSLTSLESAVEAGAPMPAERDEMDLAIDRLAVQRMLRGLSPRDRAIVYLRFYEELTQARIGDEFGQSQMQVSRTLSRILTRLRADLHQPAEAG